MPKKRITFDELRTRFTLQGHDLETVEEKIGCYEDCYCDELQAEIVWLKTELKESRQAHRVACLRAVSPTKANELLVEMDAEIERLKEFIPYTEIECGECPAAMYCIKQERETRCNNIKVAWAKAKETEGGLCDGNTR